MMNSTLKLIMPLSMTLVSNAAPAIIRKRTPKDVIDSVFPPKGSGKRPLPD